MKRIGNVVSGICLLICGAAAVKATSEGLTDTLDHIDHDHSGSYLLEAMTFVVVVGTIVLLFISTGMRLIGIRINIGKAKSS